MANWHVKAGTVFDDPSCKFYVYLNLAGYDEDDYETQDDSDISAEDPFMKLGGAGGVKEVQIGLDSHYRIRITNTGIEAWDEGTSAWVDLIGGGIAGNVFKEIDCPAGTDPIAVGAVDTLVLTSGNNILTITGDILTNTIDFVVVEGNIDHNALNNYVAGQHFTMLDEDDMVTDSDTQAATQQSIAAFVREFFEVITDPNGFPNATDSVLSFDAGTRKFTINRTGASFDIWQLGIRTTITTDDVVDDNYIIIANTSGIHFIYYDGGKLAEAVNPSDAEINTIIKKKVSTAIIYWNANDGAAYVLARERHGTVMSGKTHEWIHNTIGAVYFSGFTLSDYVEDIDDNVSLTFKIENGIFNDEDISFSITDGNPANQYEQQLSGADAELPIMYRDDIDGTWKEDAATNLPYKSLGAGRLAYNKDDGDGTFSQVEITDNTFVTMTIIATNDWQYPIKAIQGQNIYADKRTAIEEATNEILVFGDFLTPETVILFRIILNSKDTFGGTKKAKIVSVVDFRTSGLSGAANAAQDHGTLAGLADPDHPQYLLVVDIDDIPVNAETAQPISSNWAYDHKESPTDINHLTDAEVAALHATYTDAEAVLAVEAAGIDIATTKTLGFVDDVAGVFVDRIYDEDDLATDDEHGLATVQSIKAAIAAAAGADANAIHVNAGAEISGIANKAAPVDADYLVIEDSEAADAKKHITIGDLPVKNNYIPTIIFHYDDGFTYSSTYISIITTHADTNAWVQVTFICPESRDDWQIGIVHGSTVAARTSSGTIKVGKYLPGTDPYGQTNVFNNVNMDLINTNIYSTTMYMTSTGTFTAVKGDLISAFWQMDANSGTGSLIIPALYLFHA